MNPPRKKTHREKYRLFSSGLRNTLPFRDFRTWRPCLVRYFSDISPWLFRFSQ